MSGEHAPRTRSDLVRLLESRGTAFEVLEDGPRWALVTPGLAARILGAGVDQENAFWVSPSSPPPSGWFNAGGQRTWLAPEGGPGGIFCGMDLAAWTVPGDLDPASYRPDHGEGAHRWRAELHVRSADGSTHRVGISRSMALGPHPRIPGAMAIRFRHELSNRGDCMLDRRISLWGLIQLPCEEGGGAVFVCLTRPGAAPVPYFGEVPDPVPGDDGRAAWFRLPGGARFKAGIPASSFAGTLGFVRRSRLPRGAPLILAAMTFRVQPVAAYLERAPALWRSPAAAGSGGDAGDASPGDAAQVYQDPGTGPSAFCEIEAHAPAPRLAPGEASAEDILITIAAVDQGKLSDALAAGFGPAVTRIPAGLIPE